MCTGNKRNQKMNHILRSKSLINKTFVKRKERIRTINQPNLLHEIYFKWKTFKTC